MIRIEEIMSMRRKQNYLLSQLPISALKVATLAQFVSKRFDTSVTAVVHQVLMSP